MDDPRASVRLDPAAGGKMLDEALAKPNQSYREHVTDVYVAWCGLVKYHHGLIERVCEKYGIPTERFLKSSLLTVALHDVGKLSENFQRMMRALSVGRDEYRKAVQRNYRHEIAGLWLVRALARALGAKYGRIPGQGLLEVLAVAGHHKYLADGYLFDEERFIQDLDWNPTAWDAVKAAFGLAQAMFKEQGWRLPGKVKQLCPEEVNKHLSAAPDNHPFKCMMKSKKEVKILSKQGERFRELFILLKGLLMAADWMASGAVDDPKLIDVTQGVVRAPADLLFDHMKCKVEEDRKKRPELSSFTGFAPFQEECASAEGHVLAIAPTGSGKTEAALLWALHQIERGHARKLIILMPTMVTANSLHERVVAFFGKHGHEVGLVHSTADLVRDNENSEADRSDVRANHLCERHFFHPVTICTVDQLLASFFHAGRWALKTFAAANAAIVIDEIHAYDPHTTGLITFMLEQLRDLGTRFMVMSATMPSDLRETVLQSLAPAGSLGERSGVTVVEEKSLLSCARSTWECCDTPLSEWLSGGNGTEPAQEIRDLLERKNDRDQPLKVLIVVNTVKRCQEIAKSLRELNPVCYHSKFIFRDRRCKERLITHQQPQLVVATQVVEVSLDIDYDVLLTECAPMDALVQRAGRVNRARRPAKGQVVVHPPEEKSEKIYGEPDGILESTWRLCLKNQGALSENDLIRLVEEAYEGRTVQSEPAYQEIRSGTKAVQGRLAGTLDSPKPMEEEQLATRLTRYLEISVIPDQFKTTVSKLTPRKRRLYELKMPYWYVTKHRIKDQDLPLCRMRYDSRLGATFLSTESEDEPGTAVF